MGGIKRNLILVLTNGDSIKLKAYENLVSNFPLTKDLFENKKQKAIKFKKLLDRIVDNFDDEIR